MFKRTALLSPMLIAAAALAGTAIAGEGALQQNQITDVEAYTVYDIEGRTGEYDFDGIKEKPQGGAELVLHENGEVYYLQFADRVYCPDNPAHPLTFVNGSHREHMGVAYCDSEDDTSNRVVFVDGWGFRLQDYEGPENFSLNGVYEPGVMSKGAFIVTQFKYVYGGYNKADYHGKVAAYLQAQAPVQEPLAQAWEQEHAAELAEIEMINEAYWADKRAMNEEALRATFADDPGVTVTNDLGRALHIDVSGTGADQWMQAGDSIEISCKRTIQEVDDNGSRVADWDTRQEDCGGSVGLSAL